MTDKKKPARNVYRCRECGAQAVKWTGQCPECQAWNTLDEARAEEATPRTRFGNYSGSHSPTVQPLEHIELQAEARQRTGLEELDRVLGGGLVSGSVVLLGGDPGIGKSTLLLQTLAHLAKQGTRTLYVTGEESLQQIALRAQRLHVMHGSLRVLAETCIERVLDAARQEQPQVIVLDSVQTAHTEWLQSAPGSVAQVRESAAQLVRYAKQSATAVFLVGHVTKDGALAGPRVLEHMVDAVLYFEGDVGSRFRLIRAIKNRFGAANELGVFAMTEHGLREVANPSAIFLSRQEGMAPGSAILVTWEGTRPLLVEVQALVDDTHLPAPRRVTLGLEQNRLAMLLAVLHRHGGVPMMGQDVFVNVVGGVRISETAADLAVLLAVLSSFRDKLIPADWVMFGEVGLAGEIRPVPHGLERLRAAAKHGFRYAITPKPNVPKEAIPGLEILPVSRLSEALALLSR